MRTELALSHGTDMNITDMPVIKDIVWHEHDVNKAARSAQKSQAPCIIWFAGLSGSGKSTIIGALEQTLFGLGQYAYLLDGDNVRHGLNKDLGFSDEDHIENTLCISGMSKLLVDAGMVVLSALISSDMAEQRMVSDMA
jgi:adenylylsulfate kinase